MENNRSKVHSSIGSWKYDEKTLYLWIMELIFKQLIQIPFFIPIFHIYYYEITNIHYTPSPSHSRCPLLHPWWALETRAWLILRWNQQLKRSHLWFPQRNIEWKNRQLHDSLCLPNHWVYLYSWWKRHWHPISGLFGTKKWMQVRWEGLNKEEKLKSLLYCDYWKQHSFFVSKRINSF